MIIIYCLGLLLLFQLPTFIVYGGFVSKEVTDVYMSLDKSKLILNMFDPSILSTGGGGYIASVPFSIFSKYYIDGFGTIPRWSKLHKRVKEYYTIAAKTRFNGA